LKNINDLPLLSGLLLGQLCSCLLTSISCSYGFAFTTNELFKILIQSFFIGWSYLGYLVNNERNTAFCLISIMMILKSRKRITLCIFMQSFKWIFYTIFPCLVNTNLLQNIALLKSLLSLSFENKAYVTYR
ncbi:hypothetical protein L9F63_019048, partial [Diploptera punctata]